MPACYAVVEIRPKSGPPRTGELSVMCTDGCTVPRGSLAVVRADWTTSSAEAAYDMLRLCGSPPPYNLERLVPLLEAAHNHYQPTK